MVPILGSTIAEAGQASAKAGAEDLCLQHSLYLEELVFYLQT